MEQFGFAVFEASKRYRWNGNSIKLDKTVYWSALFAQTCLFEYLKFYGYMLFSFGMYCKWKKEIEIFVII